MSIAAQTGWACLRAILIAVAALSLAFPLARWMATAPPRSRWRLIALLLAPLLAPSLLVSYAYSRAALWLAASPAGDWLLYCAALLVRFTPVAVLVLHFLPPPLSSEAAHVHSLLAKPGWETWRFRWRGAGRAPWLAAALVFLLAFSDFELASLWNLKTWTVVLFDAQAGGLAMAESLRLAGWPLSVQIAVLVLAVLAGGRETPSQAGQWRPPGARARHALLVYLVASAVFGCVAPMCIVAGQSLTGMSSLARNFVLGRDLAASVCFSFLAAFMAWVVSGWIARRQAFRLVLCLPGLLGALQLALLILALFQVSLFHGAYDTSAPLLIALTALLLPYGAPLRRMLDQARCEPALHIARQCGSGELLWTLDLRRRWLAAALLFCWAYFDFTASAILAPVGQTPVFVRLHNLMHYGQTAALSAMLCAAFAAVVVVLLLTGAAARLYARRDGR